MKSLHIRNIDYDMLENLKRLARSHNRSLQGEIHFILTKAARMAPSEDADEELDLVTVKTDGRSNWDRDEIYGNRGR